MWVRRLAVLLALFLVGLVAGAGMSWADPTNLVLTQDATTKVVTATWASSAGDLTSAPVWDLTSDRSNFGHKVTAGITRSVSWTPDNDGLCGRTWLFTMTEREGSSSALTASVSVARALFAPQCPTGTQAGQVVTVGNWPTPEPTPHPVTVVGPVVVRASAGEVLPVREVSPVPESTHIYNYSTSLNCTASPEPSPTASPSPSPSGGPECAVSARLAEGQPVVTTVVLILGTLLLLTLASFLVRHGRPWRV